MKAYFLCPPMLGTYAVENAKEGEVQVRPCLVIAWDNHSENYLVADRETGEQSWKSIQFVAIDGDALIAEYGMEDTHANSLQRETQKDDEGAMVDEDCCPVCKQPMPD